VALITNGLPIFASKSLHFDTLSSYRLHHLSSPVSFLILAALRFRISGAYVSRQVKTAATETPARMRTIQLLQRQPRYWKTKPPIMGPVTGPLRGAMDQMDIARARYSSFVTSTTEPGLFAMKAAAKRALLKVS